MQQKLWVFAVAEVGVSDLGNVGSIGGLCNVDFARIDEFLEVVFVSFSPGLYGGGNNRGQAAGKILWQWQGCWLAAVCCACMGMMCSNQCVPITTKFR